MKATRAWPGYLDAFAEIVRRIESSLAASRATLKEPVRIFVAGGAAVHAYTGARISADIDATLSRRVLSPTDLAVSKIARMAPNDREDIRSLAAAGLLDADVVRQRADEALAGYVGDPRMVRIAIDEAGEIIRAAAPRKRK
jgi:hypothetical protein